MRKQERNGTNPGIEVQDHTAPPNVTPQRARRETGPRPARWPLGFKATLALLAALAGGGWTANEYMHTKADASDLDELTGEVLEIKQDVRSIVKHLEIEGEE